MILEGIGSEENKKLDGAEVKVRFYVNSIGSWASTVNPIITTSVTVGSRIFYPLEQEMVEKVIALGKPLYIVFAGSFLNNKIVENLGQIRLTTSIVNQKSFIERSRFNYINRDK